MRREEAAGRPRELHGFLTDASLCIGCKACQVACKQWNELPGLPEPAFVGAAGAAAAARLGGGYDATGALGAHDWRHVAFVELPGPRWSFLSDVCKHCARAGCLDACPTGAIVRTELGTVVVQDGVCNGCGYCVASCPFGVIGRSELDGGAHKCTLCHDRTPHGLLPACAQACPTGSIAYGELVQLRVRGRERVEALAARGRAASLYGEELAGGLSALFVIEAPPEAYGLPARADSPSARFLARDALATLAAAALGLALLWWGA